MLDFNKEEEIEMIEQEILDLDLDSNLELQGNVLSAKVLGGYYFAKFQNLVQDGGCFEL